MGLTYYDFNYEIVNVTPINFLIVNWMDVSDKIEFDPPTASDLGIKTDNFCDNDIKEYLSYFRKIDNGKFIINTSSCDDNSVRHYIIKKLNPEDNWGSGILKNILEYDELYESKMLSLIFRAQDPFEWILENFVDLYGKIMVKSNIVYGITKILFTDNRDFIYWELKKDTIGTIGYEN